MQFFIILNLLVALFTAEFARAESPVIWNGTFAKSLAAGGFQQKDGKLLGVCLSDPSSGGGLAANEGSVCQYDAGATGTIFVKDGATNTSWANVLTGSSGWSLTGNAGTGGTAFLGTTDAQNFGIRANNTNILNFKSAFPGFDTGVTQIPADNVGINQFDFRVYTSPTSSTTNASHTGVFSQLVYDNGNTGFNSTGGSYLANSSNFVNNGSGTLGYASTYAGSANFNNAGTTNQFKGVTSENGIASGTTVSDYYGMVSGLNTTGGIVPASVSHSLYGNFTDATIGNAFGINQTLNFFGTTANSQGAFGINAFLQLNDTTNFAGTSYAISSGIDLNDDVVANGFNGINFYSNVRDNASAGGINLSNVAINHSDAATSNGSNGYNANMQYSGTSTGGGVNIFSGYVRTFDTAHLDGLTGVQLNPEIEGNSDVDNINLGSFSAQIRGNATVDNLTGMTINPQMSGTATVTNFMGMNVNPQVNGTSTLTNGLTGIQISPSGTVPLNQVTALNINTSGVTLTPAALAAGGQIQGINSDGALNSGYNYTVPGASGFFQINYLGGGPTVANGDPTSAFGFGNNLAHSVTLHDDWNLDPSGLGFVDVGFVGSLGFDAGTTMAQWTGALGGAGNPSGAGTLTTAKMFSAAGILPQGGSLAVTNMYGFEVNPNLFCVIGTNCWGFYEDTASAENHVSKLAIGTASKKVANSSTALEIGNSKAFLNGRGSTATKNALTAVQGMQFYDTTLNELQTYDGASWVSVGSGGITELTGDVTAGPGSGSQTATIANSAVTNAKMANMADGTIKSNISGGAAAPSDNTMTAILDDAFGSTVGSLLVRDNAGWGTIPGDSSGYVLTAQGVGVKPIYAPASGSSFSPSEIWLQGVGGTPYGTVGTKRPRFVNTPVKSVGADVTYTDSSNDGTIMTINTTGGYCVNYTSAFSGSAADMGLTLNNTQGSTNIGSVTATDVIVLSTTAASAISGTAQVCSNFTAGDTISPQTDGTTISSALRSATFRIVRVY